MKTETYEDIPLDKIRPDPNQPRKTFLNIEELAGSIAEVGLLQNLVLRYPNGLEDPEFLYIVAGERRYRALLLNQSKGLWGDTVHCCIKGDVKKADNMFMQLAENDSHDPLPCWRSGFKYNEALDMGFTQVQVATRVGKNPNYIAVCCQIASGLHPKIVARLDKIPSTLPRNKILAISKLVNEDYEPDFEKQTSCLDNFLTKKRHRGPRKRDSIPEKERFFMRFTKLRNGLVNIPPEYQLAYEAIMAYLEGKELKIRIL